MVLKHVAAIVAGALIALPAASACAETIARGAANGREAPAIVSGVGGTAPLSRRSPSVQISPAKPLPGPVGISEPAPTAAEIAGKSLAPRTSDPDVPLPHPDLAVKSEPPAALTGPMLYGRQEPGGGILGFRMPIPAERSGTGANTIYGGGSTPASSLPPSPLHSR